MTSGSRLSFEKTLYANPKSFQNTAVLMIKIIASTPFFMSPTCGNLAWRPLIGPSNFAPIYPVVRLAVLLPVPYRWVKSWSTWRFLKLPLGWTERCSDLGTASAGAQMRRRSEFLRNIKDSRV
ncbi:MAG: hypothetical protein JWR26_2872 [Pedosphaera sp.]|nr:hypothetical protein [Pedosphaera sp.]